MSFPAAAYDAIADWYDQSVREKTLLSGDDRTTSELFSLIGSIECLTLCDLACGQGYIARQMAQRGAKVTGIDLSQKLLAIALRAEKANPQGIIYVHEDAQSLACVESARFDGVLCHMALMDIPDLTATFCAVRRVLRPEGWFAFTITHPCFQIPPSQSYYDEGFWRSNNPHGVRGQVGAHHRTLATYLNTLAHADFFVKHLSEPRLPGRDKPVVLTVLCQKGAAST